MEQKKNKPLPLSQQSDTRSFTSKVNEIFNGWKNVVFKNPQVEKIAKARAEICASCKFNIRSRCSKCGCPLIAKTRSMQSHCPLKLW